MLGGLDYWLDLGDLKFSSIVVTFCKSAISLCLVLQSLPNAHTPRYSQEYLIMYVVEGLGWSVCDVLGHLPADSINDQVLTNHWAKVLGVISKGVDLKSCV